MARGSTSKQEITIVEAVKLAEGYLDSRGVSSPRLSAELILSHILGCRRLDLYLRFDERLKGEILERYREALKKRARHYPVQYITGEVEFFSLPFKLVEGVFIPRPETELLVEWVEELVGSRGRIDFFEFGSGSGVISGTLARRHEGWRGFAIDIVKKAAMCTLMNLKLLGVESRVSVAVSDGFSAFDDGAVFDLVVSNPPYIKTEAIDGLEPEVSVYENRIAIDGGSDGLMVYPRIIEGAFRLLKDGGYIVLEIGHGQMRDVLNIMQRTGFRELEGRKDYNGLERLVMGVR